MIHGVLPSITAPKSKLGGVTTLAVLTTHGATQAGPEAGAAVRIWLWCVAALVFAMVVVGGATRLTDSGLSITEWQPILGAVPPLSDADWRDAFEKYKQIPEYAIVNKGFSLSEFKAIYWWEWTHRFLGRFIGVAFAIPFIGFLLAGKLRGRFAAKLLGVFALGGLQGGIGWYMVMSGLVDRIDVSQYRLALHLSVAFAILSLLVWLALDAGRRDERVRLQTVSRGEWWFAFALFALVFVQSGLGALVAGLKAGYAFNTWPLMDGSFVPEGILELSPWYLNVFENIPTVQFDHRIVAYMLVALALVHVVKIARSADDERLVGTGGLLAGGLLVQMGIGIYTVISAVPLHLGLAHQAGAAVVVGLATLHLHAMTHASAR